MSAEEKLNTTPYVPPMVQDDVSPDDSQGPPESEQADEGGTSSAVDNSGSSTSRVGDTETKAPIKLKDAVGRMVIVPWHIANNWKGMSDFIDEACRSVTVICHPVSKGQYDLISPDGDLILPMAWDHIIQPGWKVTMVMWSMLKESKEPPPSEPPGVPPSPSTESSGVLTPPPARRSKDAEVLLHWLSRRPKSPKEASPELLTDRGRRSPPWVIKDINKSKRAGRGAVDLQLGLNHENASWRYPSSVSTGSSSSPPYKAVPDGRAARQYFNEHFARPTMNIGRRPGGLSAAKMTFREERLVVVCKAHDRLVRRPTQLLNSAGRHALPSPDRLVFASARTCWEGPAKIGLAALELIAQKKKTPSPIEQAEPSAEGDHATWLHVRRSVMNFHEFEDIAQFDLAKNRATSSAIGHLLHTIRAEKLDDDWYIKPATVMRCDTEAGESPASSVIFVSVPYLCASSFTASSATEKADGICAPRRLHEAFSILSASADRDKGQGFRINEGRAADQVLWVRQAWVLITESGLLTYGNISKQDLAGDSITVREPISLDEEGDKIIQLVDEDRRLYYSLLSKCKSFYELQVEVRNQLSRAGHIIDGANIQLEVSEGEPMTPERWSSLLKQSDIPLIKISITWPSSKSDSSSSTMSSDYGSQEPSESGSVSASEDNKPPVSRSRNSNSTSRGSSRRADTSSSDVDQATFLVVPKPESNAETQDSVPAVPQMNRQVPPFLAWPSTDNSGAVSEAFREGVGLTEASLLHLDKFQRSSKPLRELYNAFNDENIYEKMRECSPEDFAHRRRALGDTNGSDSGSGVSVAVLPLSAGKSKARIEEFLDCCIPAFESFMSPGLPSPLTSKFFGALFMIIEDLSRTILGNNPVDETSDPDLDTRVNDHGTRHGWVISRQKVTQHGLRPITPSRDGQYKCGDCERGLIYPSPDEAKAHLREMHLVNSRSDEELRGCLISVGGARAEWLESEVDAILSTSRDAMGSMLRKLAHIQDGVLFEGEFQAPKNGLPYALLDAFKLIVAFVCAVARLLHDVHLFYQDFTHEGQSRDMTSRKNRAKKKALLNVGEAAGDLIMKADRALVSPTEETAYDGPENFMTSVGIHYVGLQIICNIFQIQIHNKKKAASLYEAYVKNLRSNVIRSPKKRQVPVIGALAEELNLLKEFNEWQTEPLRSLEMILRPRTYHQDLRRATDRDKLSELEGELITRQMRELDRDRRHLSEVLDLCSRLIQQVRELAEIMEGDQSRAVVVFTVVTVIFLPLSFVASYISMGGGVEGLEISWADIQKTFWSIAGPLTTGVAILCLALTGKRSLARLKSAMSAPWWGRPWYGPREKEPPEWERETVTRQPIWA